MKFVSVKLKTLVGSFLTVAALSLAQSALAAPAVELLSKVEIDKVIVNKDGTKETKRIVAKKVAPDGEVIYTTTFKNIIDKPVGNIAITNAIPANTVYIADSATGDNTDITFSVDGGKTYNKPENLKIISAEGKERPALAADYNAIRWAYKGNLDAGKSGAAIFKAKVK